MDFLTYIAARAVGLVLGWLPVSFVVFVGRTLGVFAWYCAPSYRRLVRRNLRIAFGTELDDAQRSAIGREHFARLAGNMAAGACLSGASVERLMQLIDFEGVEHLRSQELEGRGMVMLIAHLGNWELLARLAPKLFGRVCGTVYQRLTNPYIDAWVRSQRNSEGVLLFDRKDGFHAAIDLLRKGGAVGVLGDQHAGDAGLWCPFFGRLASTTPLLATMALRTGAAIIAIVLYTRPGGRWRLVVEPLSFSDSVGTPELTCQLNGKLEKLIRLDPADWLWAHNRWKTPNPRFLAIGAKRGVHLHGLRQPFRLMVRSVNWLGDAVMMTPAVRALRRSRPDLELTVLCQPKLADFWRTVSEVDKVVELPASGRIRDAARVIRAGNYDAAIVFPNSLRTGLEVWLAEVPVRVGYDGHFRAGLLNFRCPQPAALKQHSAERHQVYHYLDLAEYIGARETGAIDCTGPGGAGPQAARKTVHRVAVCPGAEYGPAKRWFPERFAGVIRAVSERHPVEWTLVGVAKDGPIGTEIENSVRGAGVTLSNRIGSTSMSELIELLRQSDLLLTNDTGTMHLAASLGVRVVAVFGSTDAALTGPLGTGHSVLQHRVPCGPCFQRECHLDFDCMRGIDVGQVVSAVESLLPKGGAGEKGSRDATL
jgi:heptosyltransferase-2